MATETETKKPFYSSVIDTVTGFFGGVNTGAVVGGAVGATAGAAGVAAITAINPTLGNDVINAFIDHAPGAAELTNVLPSVANNIGDAAILGAIGVGTAGAWAGATIGGTAGAVAGYQNSRPDAPSQGQSNELAHQQEVARAQATGMVQGATLAKLEQVDQTAQTAQQQAQTAQQMAVVEHEHAQLLDETTKWRAMHPSRKVAGVQPLFTEQLNTTTVAAAGVTAVPSIG
jgi:hypothetical protein